MTARFFEEKNVELFNMFEQRDLEKRLRKANQACRKREFCCDLACGPGTLIEKQVLEFENVVGLDISKEMISICKAKGLGNKADLVVGDAENLPFRETAFDILTIHAALHHLPLPENCFKETYRVLGKEGVIYIDHEPNSKRFRCPLEVIKKILSLSGELLDKKRRGNQSQNNALFPPQYWMADIQQFEGFRPADIRMQLETIGFYEAKTSYRNTFSTLFCRLPTPFDMLSMIDSILNNMPLIKQFSSHICIQARK